MENFKQELANIDNGVLLLEPLDDIKEIYHYTSVEGLKGILESNVFRISHSYFFNDTSEIKYAYQVIGATLKEMMDRKEDELVVRVLRLMKTHIEKVVAREIDSENIVERSSNFRPAEYILSFSLNRDSLSVWSEFTKGRGYSIGLNLNEYLEELKTDYFTVPPIAGKVIYDLGKQQQIIQTKINEYVELYLKYIDIWGQDEELFLTDFMLRIRLFTNFFKNPKFYSNEEFRIVFYNEQNDDYIYPKYRIKDNILIPYINSQRTDDTTKKVPIKSVTIGPTNHSDIAKEGLAYFLMDLGYDLNEIQLFSSEIPLRY